MHSIPCSRNPVEKYREVFLAVIGITPQVLTECLYYYYSEFYKEQRFFNKIVVFTTTIGRDKLVDTLFKQGKLKELEKALGMKPGKIPFDIESIKILTGPGGAPLDDIRTTEENENSFALIYDEVNHWTSQPDVRVTATVAGGRKTMGAQMAFAFQLYGRVQDELIHIIAPEDRMQVGSDWFFPGDPAAPDEWLDVAVIPVLRVGRYLGKLYNLPPAELAKKMQRDLVSHGKLKSIVVTGNIFRGDDEELKMPPKLAAYLRYLLKRRLQAPCMPDCPGCEQCCASKQELEDDFDPDILEEWKIISGEHGGHVIQAGKLAEDARKRGYDQDNSHSVVNETISRLCKTIYEGNISLGFKEHLRPRPVMLDPTSRKFVWHGVLVNKDIIAFKD